MAQVCRGLPPTKPGFQHIPLHRSSSQIRLVRLLRCIGDGILRLEMRNNVSFGRRTRRCSVAYTALSYEWGPEQPSQMILVNGDPFNVRQNICLFLDSLYEHHDGIKLGWLWIDAICIDQTCLTERNSQVKLMKEIYTNAEQVLAWLGPSNDLHDENVFQACNWVGGDHELGFGTVETLIDRFTFHEENGSLEILQNTPALIAAKNLIHRPYWTRLWIIQELALASSATIICGPYRTRLQNLLAMSWLRKLMMTPNNELFRHNMLEDFSQFRRLRYYIQKREDVEDWSLLRLIQILSSNAQCTVPHDKVYGLLGLAGDNFTGSVDYMCSVEQIFVDIVRENISHITTDNCYELANSLGIDIAFDRALGLTIKRASECDSKDSIYWKNEDAHLQACMTRSRRTPHSTISIFKEVDATFIARMSKYTTERSFYEHVVGIYCKRYDTGASGSNNTICDCDVCRMYQPQRRSFRNMHKKQPEDLTAYAFWQDGGSETFDLAEMPYISLIFGRYGRYAATIFFDDMRDRKLVAFDPFQREWQNLKTAEDGDLLFRVPIASILFMASHIFRCIRSSAGPYTQNE